MSSSEYVDEDDNITSRDATFGYWRSCLIAAVYAARDVPMLIPDDDVLESWYAGGLTPRQAFRGMQENQS